jgi:hypothetical protein
MNMSFKTIVLGLAALVAAGSANAANLVTNGSFNSVTPANAGPGDILSGDGFANLSNGSGFITGWTVSNHADIAAQAWYIPNGQADTVPGSGFWYNGWALHGPATGSNNGLGPSPDGGPLVEIDGGGDYRASLDQTINGLVAGKKYDVKFYWGGGQQSCCGGTTTEQVVVSLGGSSQSTAVWNNPERGFSGWFAESFRFTAGGTSEVLSFLAIGTPYGQPPVVLLDGVSLQAAVPEASTWAMLIAGFGLVGAAARRRRMVAA